METVARPARPWAAFSLAAVAQLMGVLDITVINVALPSIQKGLNFTQEDLAWVVNIYVLLFGGFLLLGGRAGDLFGRRRVFMAGVGLFTVSSLMGGLAQNAVWLVVARAAQGLSGALIAPVALAIVSSSFAEGSARNQALGIFGALAGVGSALGVLLGGVLTSAFGWQWVLFINVPIGAVVVALCPLYIPENADRGSHRGFDLAGAIAATAGLCLLVFGVVKSPDNGWASVPTIGCLAAAAVLLASFLAIEARVPAPLVRLGIFQNRSLAVANVLAFLTGLVVFAMFYFISLYEQLVLGYSALQTGLSCLPLAIAMIVTATMAPSLVARFGFKYTIALGMVLAAVGLLLFLGLPVDGSYAPNLLPGLLVVAVGLGFIFVPLPIAAVTGVDQQELGMASGLINATQQVGGAIGLAVLVTISANRFTTVFAGFPRPKVPPYMQCYFPAPAQLSQAYQTFYSNCHSAYVNGYHYAFGASAFVMVFGVVLTFVLLPTHRKSAQAPAELAAATV